mmetsp:Transcript_22294/g.48660  ORF Transcript_22294/g.48660 Transcript_22294/m.48660 type:complete len:266 (+) Transcript_22294:270-1067(+)
MGRAVLHASLVGSCSLLLLMSYLATKGGAHSSAQHDEPPRAANGNFVEQQLGTPPRQLAALEGGVQACGEHRKHRCCGDGICEGPETIGNCMADCPGITTQPVCGEEPHSDTGGHAVVFGIDHRAASAQDCCDRCVEHAKKHAASGKPCTSWVFCPLPVCWGLDTGWNHTYGECWLKWQADPAHPLYGQRGAYSEEYRKKHRFVRSGPPTHVPWTGGIIGGMYDPSIKWVTGPEGMTSSKGDELTNWRAWEAHGVYEKRLRKRQG